MARAVLGLGGNLGARLAMLRAGVALLAAERGLALLAQSHVYETPPMGPPQPHYLNAAVLVEWSGSAEALLACVRRVEQQLGRERHEHWGARTLDIDILLWSGGPIRTHALAIPHAGLAVRSFVLAPLADVLPALASDVAARLTDLGESPRRLGPLAPPALMFGAELTLQAESGAVSAAELLSAAVRGCAAFAPAPLSCREVLSFAVALPLELAVSELVAQLDTLARSGFGAACGAVTHCDERGFRGLFAGERREFAVPCPRLRAEFGSSGPNMWVKIARLPA